MFEEIRVPFPFKVFSKLVNQKLEEPLTGAGSASQFLVQRSPSFDGMLDVNVKRQGKLPSSICLQYILSKSSNRQYAHDNNMRGKSGHKLFLALFQCLHPPGLEHLVTKMRTMATNQNIALSEAYVVLDTMF